MRYVHISHTPGHSMADYRNVVDALGDGPAEGNVLHIVGDADGALHIVDVWESRAAADRFAAERLLPAFQRTGRGPGSDATYVAFETDRVTLSGDGQQTPTAP